MNGSGVRREFVLAIASAVIQQCAMPLFLFEPDRKVSLRAFAALALAVIFYVAQ
jgi:hypothetical protein